MAKFGLGKIVATPCALELLEQHSMITRTLTNRHRSGDWGDMCDEDKASNDAALERDEEGLSSRIFSSYNIGEDDKVWVITEWDESVTTLLLPSEY